MSDAAIREVLAPPADEYPQQFAPQLVDEVHFQVSFQTAKLRGVLDRTNRLISIFGYILKPIAAMFILGITVSSAHANDSHCTATEKTVFSCKAGKKTISVCAIGDDLQYRFGRIGSPDLTLPKTPGATGAVVKGSIVLAGGGGAYLRFINGKTDYVVYTAENKSVDKAGVAVEKDGKLLANVACSSHGRWESNDTFGPTIGEDVKDFDLP